MAAYGIERVGGRTSRFLYVLFIAGLMIPFQVRMIPLVQGFDDVGLYSTLLSVILVHLGGAASFGAEWAADVRGTWKFGDNGTVCTSVVLDGPTIRANFPPRCQYWYRLRDRFYVAESDTDRRARVLPRSQVE